MTMEKHRQKWTEKIISISDIFVNDSDRVHAELIEETKKDGSDALLKHLRLCTAMPEKYSQNSSEEKLYSKYTDSVLSLVYTQIGLNSSVLTERADAADVIANNDKISFVADAKVFRLTRTAKNQKDFKVSAMHNWKHGRKHAMVVCPIYQLPTTTSQIYRQATTVNVCIFSYLHLSTILRFSEVAGQDKAQSLLEEIFATVDMMNPSKSAVDYWTNINQTMRRADNRILELWTSEKIEAGKSLDLLKRLATKYYIDQKEQITRMTKDEAISALLKHTKFDSRIGIIEKIGISSDLI